MVLPLPQFQSLGQMISDRLEQGNRNALLGEELKSRRFENELAPQRNKMQMQKMEQENQLFPLELEKQQINNKLLAAQLEDFKPKNETERAYKNALIQKMQFQQQNPLYGQPGVAGQIGAAQVSDPETARTIMQALQTNLSGRQSQAALQSKQAQGYEFNSLPVGSKEYLLAQVAGMGIDPDQGRRLLTSGKTLPQIAIENGYDPENLPEPVYPLTKAGQTAFKGRQAANEEIKALGKKISEAMEPYSRKIAGYSPKQVVEALKGENKESQAKLLAARALQPELASIRLRMGGGNVGIEAIREMTDTSMGHINVFEGLVSPDVYSKANKYVDEWLSDAVDAANRKATQGFSTKSNKESSKENDPLGIR